MRSTIILALIVAAWCPFTPAFAGGDEGHEVVGLIALRYLEPGVRRRVQELLAKDRSGLTATDVAHEATWADKFRDSDRDSSKAHYYATRDWHFVDLEVEGTDMRQACFGEPKLAPGAAASAGPADDCIVDKIDEFAAELRDPNTEEQERVLALQFLLHFVGDLHQPLHAADDHDQGGNKKIASVAGIAANTLHHDWDTEFVARLGANDEDIAPRLIEHITPERLTEWSAGSPAAWALETFSVAKSHAYGMLPAPDASHRYELPSAYVADATSVTAEQLSKAGVRLAFMLNRALR